MPAGIPQEALNEAKARVLSIKLAAYEQVKFILTYPGANMASIGHRGKSLEEAAAAIMRQSFKDCEKIFQALERKYPD